MTSTRLRTAAALCAGLWCSLAARAEVNLLVNGSFERPAACERNCMVAGGSAAIDGWTTFLSGVEYVATRGYGTGAAPDGEMAVDLANFVYPQGGGIQQSFATTAGGAYRLSFWTGNALFDGRDGTGTVRVQVAGVDTIFDTPRVRAIQGLWQQHTFNFLATSALTELRFSNTQDPLLHYALIDDVWVAPVPEQPTAWLVLCGLALLAQRRIRQRAA